MNPIVLIALAIIAAIPLNTAAIDPGFAQGTWLVDGQPVALHHAYAATYRQAPGKPQTEELRIAVTDREIPQQALNGSSPLPVESLARQGAANGVLVQVTLSSKKPARWQVLGAGAQTEAGDCTKPRLEALRVGNNRVSGKLSGGDQTGTSACAVTFSAPLFHSPETVR